MKGTFILSGVFIALACAAQPAWSQGGPPSGSSMLLGTVGNGGVPSTLVEIEPFTGDLIRTIAVLDYAVNGLAYDHTTDTLFATTRLPGGGGPLKSLVFNGLISIDVETGDVTEIGPPGGWGEAVNNLSVNSKGELFAMSGQPNDNIVTVDKTTGALTVLGPATGEGGYGLAFDGTDNLWLTDQTGDVYIVDLETGPDYIGDIGGRIHHGVFHFPSGYYIGLDTYTPVKSDPEGSKLEPLEGTILVIADYESGSVVQILETVQDLHTLAFVPQRWGRSHLIGTTGFGGVDSTLVQINPRSGGVVQTIGPIGYPVNGLEYDATTGQLFATTADIGDGYVGLIEIDIHTGEATEIGEGWGGGAPLKEGDAQVTNLTANSYGMLFGWNEVGDDLVSIDKETGTYEVVGESGIETFKYGLAFDASDRLWLTNGDGQIYLVNQATGAAVAVDTLGTGEVMHHGDFDIVSGDYYGVYTDELVIKAPVPRELARADLPSATVDEVMSTATDLHTVSFVPAAGENMLGTIRFGDQASYLVRFDTRFVGAAAMQVIGPVGYIVNGLEYDATNGKLYATTSVNDFFFNGLIEINRQTGAGTQIGSDWNQAITNLTSNSLGQLFAWGEGPFLLKAATDDLVSINKSTGVATEVGDSGVDTRTYGLAFDETDSLFLVNYDGTYSVDTASGAASFEGFIGRVAHHGDFDFLSGHYIGLTRGAGGAPMVPLKALAEDQRSLVVVNPDNHSVIAVAPGFAEGLHTLTYVPPFMDGFETGDFSRWSSVVGN